MDDTEYFSGNNPDLLVNDDVIDNINGKLDVDEFQGGSLGKTIKGVYTNLIAPNMFFFIVFFLLVLFLFIRYLIKKDKDSRKKEIMDKIKYERSSSSYRDIGGRRLVNGQNSRDLRNSRDLQKQLRNSNNPYESGRRDINEEDIEDEFTIRDEDYMTDTNDIYDSSDDRRDNDIDHSGHIDHVDDVDNPRSNRVHLQDKQMDKIFKRTFLMDVDEPSGNDDFLPYNS